MTAYNKIFILCFIVLFQLNCTDDRNDRISKNVSGIVENAYDERDRLSAVYSQIYHRLPLYQDADKVQCIRYCILNSIGEASTCIVLSLSEEYDLGDYFITSYIEGNAYYSYEDRSIDISGDKLKNIFNSVQSLLDKTDEEYVEDFLSQRGGGAYVISLEAVIDKKFKKTAYCYGKRNMANLCPVLNEFKSICPTCVSKVRQVHLEEVHAVCQ